MNKHAWVLAALLGLAFRPECQAQAERQALAQKPGTWEYKYQVDEHSSGFKITATEAADFRQGVTAVVEGLHGHKVLAHPLGFDARVRARPLYPNLYAWHRANYGIVGEISVEFCEWYRLRGKEEKQAIEPPYAGLTINNLAATIRGERNNFPLDGYIDELDRAATALNEYFARPVVGRELGDGATLYANNIIVVAKPGVPYWVPVTVRTYFEALFRYYTLREQRRQADQPAFELVKQEYAALSEKERAGPAYADGERIAGITAQPNESPILTFNPAYFNRNLPRSAIQLITLESPSPHALTEEEASLPQEEVGLLRVHQLLNSLDVAQLRARLRR